MSATPSSLPADVRELASMRRTINAYRNLVAALTIQRDDLKRGAEAALEAVKTLESERAANAVLTAENERLQARVAELERESAAAQEVLADAAAQDAEMERLRGAVEAEREACAQVCGLIAGHWLGPGAAGECAAAIRDRGQSDTKEGACSS